MCLFHTILAALKRLSFRTINSVTYLIRRWYFIINNISIAACKKLVFLQTRKSGEIGENFLLVKSLATHHLCSTDINYSPQSSYSLAIFLLVLSNV